MASDAQGGDGGVELVLLDQEIVGVVGREHEDADTFFGERPRERGQDSDLRELERALHTETAPSTFDLSRQVPRLPTNHRKLRFRASETEQISSFQTGRHFCFRSETANRETIREELEGQLRHRVTVSRVLARNAPVENR
jgi:hypothetical protein